MVIQACLEQRGADRLEAVVQDCFVNDGSTGHLSQRLSDLAAQLIEHHVAVRLAASGRWSDAVNVVYSA